MTAADRPVTLPQAFQRIARIGPDAVALRTVGDTQTLTWRDYAAQVRQVAAGLAALGVGRGDTVSLMMGIGLSFIRWRLARSMSARRRFRCTTGWRPNN